MKSIIYLIFFVLFFHGQASHADEPDIRLYLTNGDIITSKLINRAPDLIIIRARGEVHTYMPSQVIKIETLESLGDKAKIVRVPTFPHIEFLGGAVAFGSVAFLAFNSASDKQDQADLNRQANVPYKNFEDDAAKLRAAGWTATALAAGTAIFALIPRWVERKTFPDISLMMDRGRIVYVAYRRKL